MTSRIGRAVIAGAVAGIVFAALVALTVLAGQAIGGLLT
jgi:hypothetical protein